MRQLARWLGLAGLLCSTAATALERLIVANALFDGRAMLSIDGHARMLRAGQRSPEGVQLVSATAHEAVIEVDGKRQTLALSHEVGAAYQAPARREFAVPRNAQGQYRVGGRVNGHATTLLVDTGADVVALSGAEASRMGIDFRRNGQRGAANTAGGLVEAWGITLERVETGGIVVRNVPATVIEGEHPTPALLGMSWLTRVGMREDAGVLYLQEH